MKAGPQLFREQVVDPERVWNNLICMEGSTVYCARFCSDANVLKASPSISLICLGHADVIIRSVRLMHSLIVTDNTPLLWLQYRAYHFVFYKSAILTVTSNKHYAFDFVISPTSKSNNHRTCGFGFTKSLNDSSKEK